MMRKNLRSLYLLPIFLCLILFTASQAHARPGGYDYTFKIKGLQEGDTCLIAYYLGTQQYIRDTLLSDKNGVVRYKGDEVLEGGIYLFVVPGMKYFEFVLTEPTFSLETQKDDLVNSMKVAGSPENDLFFAYLQFIEAQQQKARPLRDEIGKLKKGDPKYQEAQDKLVVIDNQVKEYKIKLINDHPDTFVGRLLSASREPEVPDELKEDPDARYRYYKAHFWDGVNFSDDRLLRTPVIKSKINEYLDKLTVQDPDSLIIAVDEIIRRASVNDEVFKYCVITCTNKYAGSKKMCFDKIYVHMAGAYYVSGRATWVDSTQLSKIKDRYFKMMYNTCGRKAVNLMLPDINDKMHQLYALNGKYTILMFYSYDCGHCKKVMAKYGDLAREYKQHGVDFYGVCTKNDEEKWKKFIEEKNIGDLINVHDPKNESNFRVFYDIYSTPVVYLLDEDKKILGKRLDKDNLGGYLDHLLGIERPEGEEPTEKVEDPGNSGGSSEKEKSDPPK